MLVPSETESFIVALTPLVFRFCIILTIMFMSQHDACLFIRFQALSRGDFSVFAASAESATSTAVKYSASQSNILTRCEVATTD